MTQDYYGTKRITAWPQELDGRAGYAVKYSDGYVSWSPKNVFEEAYRPVTGMSFGHALEAMKAGKRVARAGWNGKDMWICLGEGNPALPASAFWNPHTRAHAEAQPGQVAEVLPYIIMKTAGNEVLMGWLASQSDMLAEDWVELT